MQNKAIKLGKITSAKGLKGEVKIISYTQDPFAIKNYKVFDEKGKSYNIVSLKSSGKYLVAKIEGIEDRTLAEGLKNIELYTLRESFSEPEEDSFYYVDLEGLKVLKSDDMAHVGNIIAVYNFGQDDILEFTLLEDGKALLLTFTKENFPTVNVKEGFVTVDSKVFLEQISK